APLVANLIALAIKVLPVTLIISARFSKLIPNSSVKLLLAFIYLALPNSTEIYANMANIQWHLALLACMVILAEPSSAFGWRFFDLGVMLLAALSGPFAPFLILISGLYWWLTRRHWLVFLILSLTVGLVIQGITIVLNTNAARSTVALGATPVLFAKILAGQVFISTLIGQTGYGKLMSLGGGYSLLASLIAILGVLAILYSLRKGPLELRLFIFYGTLIFGAALISATVPWNILALPGAATRYWFIPMLAFVALLVWLLSQKHPLWLRRVAILMLAIMAMGIAADWHYPALVDLHFKEYAAQFERSPQGTKVAIPINPLGWSMELIKH
ncbi:MAG: hypothetical protein WCA35_16550, partial [Kovacikia sp.]